MSMATINRFIHLFSDAFEALPVEVPMHEVERLAMIVHSAMENKRRAYHTSGHVFDMCADMNSRQVLAALFHDVVYYQLDNGFPQQAAAMLEPIVHQDNGSLILRDIDSNDTALQLCADIFGFEPGQVLPLFSGMNEFLSAVVAVRLLQPYLSMPDLLAIVACIEATVPFRGIDAEGRDMPHALADRVRVQCRKYSGLLSLQEVESHVAEVLHEAVKIANRDVAGFAESNPGKFLSGTWLLIEESNAPLAAVGVYTLQDYRGALSRMETFLAGLNPAHIFNQYDGFPDDAEFARLKDVARQNIAFVCEFLGAKIATIAIIEAMALATGGNCPVSMFLGDVRSADGSRPDRAEDFLPPASTAADVNPALLGVLEKGRAQELTSDLISSPFTAFMYRCLGRAGTLRASDQAKRMFAGELTGHEFLASLDRDMLRGMIGACARIAISRRELLQKLESSLF